LDAQIVENGISVLPISKIFWPGSTPPHTWPLLSSSNK
jgi:hypothetical protein